MKHGNSQNLVPDERLLTATTHHQRENQVGLGRVHLHFQHPKYKELYIGGKSQGEREPTCKPQRAGRFDIGSSTSQAPAVESASP